MSDIDAAMVVDSLKALDPKRPIREADIFRAGCYISNVPIATAVKLGAPKRPRGILEGSGLPPALFSLSGQHAGVDHHVSQTRALTGRRGRREHAVPSDGLFERFGLA